MFHLLFSSPPHIHLITTCIYFRAQLDACKLTNLFTLSFFSLLHISIYLAKANDCTCHPCLPLMGLAAILCSGACISAFVANIVARIFGHPASVIRGTCF